MIVHWHSEAQAEFDAAADFYEAQVGGLGERFITHVEATIAQILAHPSIRRCFHRECRKAMTDKFPYFLIYQIKDGQLQILAVMHTSRRPDYWKSRIKE